MELHEQKKGREILFTLKEETGSAIFDSCAFSREEDGRCLARAAKIIRKQMFLARRNCEPGEIAFTIYLSEYSLSKPVFTCLIKET